MGMESLKRFLGGMKESQSLDEVRGERGRDHERLGTNLENVGSKNINLRKERDKKGQQLHCQLARIRMRWKEGRTRAQMQKQNKLGRRKSKSIPETKHMLIYYYWALRKIISKNKKWEETVCWVVGISGYLTICCKAST